MASPPADPPTTPDDTTELPASAHESPVAGSDGVAGSTQARPPRRRRRTVLLVAGGVLAALAAGAYGVAYAQYSDSVPAGTTVEGVAIGGLPTGEAEQVLTDELPTRLDEPRTLLAGDRTVEVVPSEIGVTVDAAATVRAAGGHNPSPVALWRAAFGDGGEVAVVPAVDEDALGAGVAAAAKSLDVQPVDGTVELSKGKVRTEHAVVGQSVEQQAAADAIVDAYPSGQAKVTLPVAEVEPLVTQEEVDAAVDGLAKPAVSGPVPITTQLGKAEITAAQLSPAVTFEPDEDGTLALVLDAKQLRTSAKEPLADVSRSARDARVKISGGEPEVVPSRTGRVVTAEELRAKVLPAITATGADRAVTLALTTVQPTIKDDDKAVTSVKRKVAGFTTHFPHAAYRNVNIGRAAALINNTFLAPGEVFSLNGTVGERTRENGFTTGFIIDSGQFREELGGGVSQVATTTFNAAHFAGFDDVEHKAHSLYISRYPRGREATVAWPSVDLKFANNTPYGAVVRTRFSPSGPGRQGTLTVEIWSTKYWDVTSVTGPSYNFRAPTTIRDSSPRCTATSPVPGFDVKVTRTLRRDGKTARTESFVTSYSATNRVVCT